MKRVLGINFLVQNIKNSIVNLKHWMLETSKFRISMDEAMLFKPPPEVRGMVDLDRNAFKKKVTVSTVMVPLHSMQKFCKEFKNDLLKKRGSVMTEVIEETKYKHVLLKSPLDFNSLDKDKIDILKNLNVDPKIYHKEMNISYENYKHQEILTAILPEGQDATSGFERIGHIAHVNLQEHQLPYKNVIGQVILDTHKHLKTVVNKSSTIENKFRVLDMEIIAGEENMMAKVVEDGRTFEFDFSKVFWNSRLQSEHYRICHAIPASSVVFDVFAGVGPFSIPLARKGCKVYANDLNRESHKWLCHNMKLNKVTLQAFNLDGRDFIRSCLGKYIRSTDERKSEDIYVIMNLPGIAIEFLDAFKGLLLQDETNLNESQQDTKTNECEPNIKVFCYAFSSAEDKLGDIRARALQYLGHSLPCDHAIREVRSVAPGKDQLCLSFRIPVSVLMCNAKIDTVCADEVQEPEEKRPKLTTVSTKLSV